MDALLKKLNNCSVFLELKSSILYWEGQQEELKLSLSNIGLALERKKSSIQMLKPEKFFQKIFRKTEREKKRLRQEIARLMEHQTSDRCKLASLEKKIAEGKEKLDSLADSRVVYEKAKESASLTSLQEGYLVVEEISAFIPVAIKTGERILETISVAKVSNFSEEVLQNVAAQTDNFADILSVLPQGASPKCIGLEMHSYLDSPYPLTILFLEREAENIQRIMRGLHWLAESL